jgi:uncharacterized protein YutE (UPF0331/DUF86 family)
MDIARLRQFLGIIGDSVRKLRELGALSKTDFLKDFRNTESAKYLLVKAIEAAIDICNHIVATQGGRAPTDYADCFTILQELGVVSPDLAARLQKMARFRNLVVHLYWQVDDAKVYDTIHANLGDFEEFQEAIATFIAAQPS